jgi:hypothetical protein
MVFFTAFQLESYLTDPVSYNFIGRGSAIETNTGGSEADLCPSGLYHGGTGAFSGMEEESGEVS